MVQNTRPASGERWHIVSEGGTLLAKAQTHTRAVGLADGSETTLLALTGVTTHPSARGRGLGQLVVRLAFNQLQLLGNQPLAGGHDQGQDDDQDAGPRPIGCCFQTGSAASFYEAIGCRKLDCATAAPSTYKGLLSAAEAKAAALSPSGKNTEAILDSRGAPAFTDFNALVYPADALCPAVFPIDAAGYTGSWAWWAEPTAPGRAPKAAAAKGTKRAAIRQAAAL